MDDYVVAREPIAGRRKKHVRPAARVGVTACAAAARNAGLPLPAHFVALTPHTLPGALAHGARARALLCVADERAQRRAT